MSETWVVALAALVCGLVALAVPEVLRRLPEPVPDADPDPDPDTQRDEAKEPYAAIAALPRLRVGSGLAAAVAGGVLAAATGPTWSLVVLLVLVPPGVALAVVDWRTRLLPVRLVAPTYAVMVPVALLGRPVTGDWDGVLGSLVGWAVAGGLYLLLWLLSPRSLGYGDVRLSGLVGIALGHLGGGPLGWGPLLVGVWSGFVLMGVVGLVLRRRDPAGRRTYPFGPFMLLGVLVGVVLSPLVVPPPG